MDLSPAFIAGAAHSFPDADHPTTGFMSSNCLIKPWIRCAELNVLSSDLKGHKYVFEKPTKLTSDKQEKSLSDMLELPHSRQGLPIESANECMGHAK